jgi:hypothetical protein
VACPARGGADVCATEIRGRNSIPGPKPKSSWTRQSGHTLVPPRHTTALSRNGLRGEPRARGGNMMAFPTQPGIFTNRHSMLIHTKISPRLLERRPVLFFGTPWRYMASYTFDNLQQLRTACRPNNNINGLLHAKGEGFFWFILNTVFCLADGIIGPRCNRHSMRSWPGTAGRGAVYEENEPGRGSRRVETELPHASSFKHAMCSRQT